MINQEKIEDLIKEYQAYAEKNGFQLNPNQAIVRAVVKSLLEREEKFGQRFCPCRRITGQPTEDKKIICPCIYHRKEIEENGHCLCQLFVKKTHQ